MGKEDPRRGRDAAGIGPYAQERERLVPLRSLSGWSVAKGEPDIRSWEVKTLSGRSLGNVRELLVETDGGEVVMLDVDLAGTDRHAYVPIRLVEIDRAKRIIRADSGDLIEHGLDEEKVSDRKTTSRRLPRDVHYANSNVERVIERRPIVEETVVRRRDADDTETRL